MPHDLVAQLLEGRCEPCDPEDAAVVEFAVHYARTGKNPTPEMLGKLQEVLGPDRAKELILYLDAIWFANLTGNTFDSALARLAGEGAHDGEKGFEMILALAAAPILFPQAAFHSIRKRFSGR